MVRFQKRKSSRSIRITIGHSGEVKVSLPAWTPYKVAVAFVQTKQKWISKQQTGKSKHVFAESERIGKAHRLRFTNKSQQRISSRVTDTEIIVNVPEHHKTSDQDVQAAVTKAATRALKKEADRLLLPRLHSLSRKHGFSYKSARVKLLKTRWGSCSSDKDIALNCFLMQLPWELIDYVLLHELLHTRVMAHGPRFWSELDKYITDLPVKRKTMKNYHPALRPQD